MRYWFITIHRTPKRDTVTNEYAAQVLAAHTAYFKQLGREGRCLVAGPFANQKTELGAGFYVLASDSEHEARRMAADDPLAVEGLYDFKVREWIKVVPEKEEKDEG